MQGHFQWQSICDGEMNWSSYLQKVDVHGSPEYSGGQPGGSKDNDMKYSMEAIAMINTS